MTATVGSESGRVHQGRARTWGSAWLRRSMEALTLVLVCLSPWPFGSVHAIFESMLLTGVGLLAVLWSIRVLWQRRFTLRWCGVSICLAGIVLLGLWQMTPLAASAVSRIAPGTAQMLAPLLPKQAETLSDGQSYEQAPLQTNSTITVYRYVTRQDVVRWLAILVLFLAVRNNVASPASFRRLSVALLVNGVLLSYFALAQWFTSPHNTLYWTYASLGSAFGPFINRNHFAFYMNICVGLSLGLLLYVTATVARVQFPGNAYGEGGESRYRHPRRDRRGIGRAWQERTAQLLHNPRSLWIILALVLMIATVIMCLSRGGVLALIAGSAVCFLVARTRGRHQARSNVMVIVIALVVALLTWFGFDLAQSRYASLWSGQIPDQGRWQVWNYMLPAVRDFPIWGSGYGTFPYVEPLYRPSAWGLDLFWDYAHNEYLQMAIEGGITSLVLVLLAIVLVYRAAVRAYGHFLGRPTAGLVLGGVFALTTVIVHSFVEFGMHLPAITCLVTVLCAQLAGLGDTARGRPAPGDTSPADADRLASMPQLGGLIPVLAAVTGVLLAMVLHLEGQRADYAERFRLAALRAVGEDNVGRQMAALQSAVKIAPGNATLHEELAKASFAALPSSARSVPFDQLPDADRTHLLQAERHWLIARDLCPLLAEPQAWLAANAARLATGDDLQAYLQRALRIRPFDPELWYIKGLYAMEQDQQDEALRCWKKSLELAPTFLAKILDKCAGRFEAKRLLQELLPDDPQLLYATAMKLGAKTDALTPASQLVLEHALKLLDQNHGPRETESYVLQARVHKLLGQPREALAVYRTALQQDAYNIDLRYEYAELLYQQHKLTEARTELRTIVRRKPSHTGAARLLNQVLSDTLRTAPGQTRPSGKRD